MIGNSNPKMNGVVGVNSNPDGRTGPPKTIVAYVPMELAAVSMIDENGVKVDTVLYRVGDQFYNDPRSEQWAANLRTIDKKGWLGTALLAKAKEWALKKLGSPIASKADTVDVMGGG